MPAVDILFVLVLVVVTSLIEHYFFWPRFRTDIASGVRDARVRGYRRGVVAQWLFTFTAIAIWAAHGRPMGALRLTLPSSAWQLWLSAAFVLLMVAFVVLQLGSVLRLSPEHRVAARPKLGNVVFMLPHTRAEYRWFLAL